MPRLCLKRQLILIATMIAIATASAAIAAVRPVVTAIVRRRPAIVASGMASVVPALLLAVSAGIATTAPMAFMAAIVPMTAVASITVAAIVRVAVPHAHAGRITVAAVITTAVITIVVAGLDDVVAAATPVIGVAAVTGAAHIAVARIVITARKRRCGDDQGETGQQAFHDPSPQGMTAPR